MIQYFLHDRRKNFIMSDETKNDPLAGIEKITDSEVNRPLMTVIGMRNRKNAIPSPEG